MKWNLLEERTPPVNVQLDTLTEDGQQQVLIFHSNIWWVPDMSMYVYYRPKFWRVIVEQNYFMSQSYV